MLLESIESRLRAKIGLNADSLGPSAVEVAVKTRVAAHGLRGIAEYVQILDSDPQEIARLVEEVVVLETWFFREPEAMRLVAARARSALMADQSRVYRVLSVPCATGEEPYSVSMALLDAGAAPSRFRIDAIDVSGRALEIAERAVYGANSFRGKDHAFRDKYFRPAGSGFELDGRVREPVRFRRGNLVQADLLASEKPYDAIFCRNVLIYLHASARKTALASLDRLLAPDGVLLAGHAEALESMGSAFVRAGKGAAFAYVRGTQAPSVVPALRRASPRLDARPWSAQKTPAEPIRAPSCAEPAPPAVYSLETVECLADRGELEAAAEQCEKQIKSSGPSARAFCLLGVIRRAEGNLLAAEQCFAKALYLEPTHSEALLHMALIHESRGESASAQRLRRRAERAARSGGAA
jgi:chemotaxis protein methyltransferase WspC